MREDFETHSRTQLLAVAAIILILTVIAVPGLVHFHFHISPTGVIALVFFCILFCVIAFGLGWGLGYY